MTKRLVHAAGWVLVGMILAAVLTWFGMPRMMLVDRLRPRGYDESVAALSGAVAGKQDWRVLTVNDYQKSTSGFAAIERVGSINVCNPRYASMILADERNRGVTAFMPLAIGVYEDERGQVHVATLNVQLLGRMFGGTIADVMGRMAGADLNDVVATFASREPPPR